MQLDAADLADFYEAPIGQLARRMIARQVRVLWPSAKGACILGYGFAVPYLRPYLGDAERAVALMPAQQGVEIRETGGRRRSGQPGAVFQGLQGRKPTSQGPDAHAGQAVTEDRGHA